MASTWAESETSARTAIALRPARLDLADDGGRALPVGTPAAIGIGGDVADDDVGALPRQPGGDGPADSPFPAAPVTRATFPSRSYMPAPFG